MPGALAQEDYLRTVWQTQGTGYGLGYAATECLDIDGDGSNEILLDAGIFPERHFTVWKHVGPDYAPVWTSRVYGQGGICQIETADLESDGDLEIFVLQCDGTVDVYDGSTMSLLATDSTSAASAVASNIADVDNDGSWELVVLSSSALQIFDATTLTLEWSSTAYGGFDLEVGDVDGDDSTEIVVSTSVAGYILDGASRAVEWQYPGSFGTIIELGNVDADPEPEIIAQGGPTDVTAFDGKLHAALWSMNTGGRHDAMRVTDVEGDGLADVFLGDNQWGNISRYNVVTKLRMWYIPNPDHGVTDIAVGDADGDGIAEILWGAGQSASDWDQLYVAGLDSRQIEWQTPIQDGPFFVAAADLDLDGETEIIGGCYIRQGGPKGVPIMVLDAESHLMEWSFPAVLGNLTTLEVANTNTNAHLEIVIGEEDRIGVIDGVTRERLWNGSPVTATRDIAVADLDGDDTTDIVVVSGLGYIHVFNGFTGQEKWAIHPTSWVFGGVSVGQMDTDPPLEIVRWSKEGKVQVFDGVGRNLEWESSGLPGVTALSIADVELDGDMELLLGHVNGWVTMVDALTDTIQAQDSVSSEAITGIVAANLDSALGQEIVIGNSMVTVLAASNLAVKWRSIDLGFGMGETGNFIAQDVDFDGYMDLLAGSGRGIHHYESSTPYPDVTPPRILSQLPLIGAQSVGLDSDLRVVFSEAVNSATLAPGIVLEDLATSDTMDFTATYHAPTHELIISPAVDLPAEHPIRVTLLGTISDLAAHGLDGNGNGVPEGSPIDDAVWTFMTGAVSDAVGPVVLTAQVSPDTLWRGTALTLEVLISDTASPANSPVVQVECFLDSVGAPGTGIPLTAVDDEFDSSTEAALLGMSSDDWPFGRRPVFVRGCDASGHWGELREVDVYVIPEPAANWTQLGSDPQHTGFNRQDSTPASLGLKWTATPFAAPLNQVAVSGDYILVTPIVTTAEAGIACLHREDGSPVWTESLGVQYSITPPSAAYGNAYVQICGGNRILCLDLKDGALEWQGFFLSQSARYFAPTITDGRVFVQGGFTGGMYAYDAFDGRFIWNQSMQAADEWTPAVHAQSVYGFAGGQLTVAETATGVVQWGIPDVYLWIAPTSMNASPIIDTTLGLLLLPSPNYIHVMDLATRKVKYAKTGPFRAAPAIGNGLMYTIWAGDLYVYNEITGKGVWYYNAGRKLAYPPVISSGYVFVSGTDSCHAINLTTHQKEWSYPASGYLTVANHHLYVASGSGTLYAFEGAPVSVTEPDAGTTLPSTLTVEQNFPNPFNAETVIRYSLPEACKVEVEIFNVLGRRVATLVDEEQTAGTHSARWRPQGLGSGLYFYVVSAGEFVATRKLLLLK